MKIEHQMEMHKLYTHYHLTRASTGDYKRDKVTDGSGTPLSEEELLKRCLDVANTHIRFYIKCCEEVFKEF